MIQMAQDFFLAMVYNNTFYFLIFPILLLTPLLYMMARLRKHPSDDPFVMIIFGILFGFVILSPIMMVGAGYFFALNTSFALAKISFSLFNSLCVLAGIASGVTFMLALINEKEEEASLYSNEMGKARAELYVAKARLMRYEQEFGTLS